MKRLKHALHWFEIPVRDISRAKKFYEAAFELKLSDLNLANGLTMALFPVEEETIGGALCQHKDFYHPGQTGPVVYLNADPDLQPILARIVQHGGKGHRFKDPDIRGVWLHGNL